MRQYLAFTKKEILEQTRSGRLLLLTIISGLFGILNPATAKLTPWMMEVLSGQLAEAGMTVTAVEVDAFTSWTQFFKNMPMALLICLILFSGILTAEYQRGTLVHAVAKGMKRWKILAAKMSVMAALWTAGYLFSYGITYGYNAFFWDNRVVHCLPFAAFCLYLYGMWLLTVLLLASALCRSSAAVMLMVGAAWLASYAAGMFPALKEYSPCYLLASADLLTGAKDAGDYLAALLVTVGLALVCGALSVPVFERRDVME